VRDGGLHILHSIERGSSLLKGFKGTKGRTDWFRDESWQLRCYFRSRNIGGYHL